MSYPVAVFDGKGLMVFKTCPGFKKICLAARVTVSLRPGMAMGKISLAVIKTNDFYKVWNVVWYANSERV